MFPTNSIFDTMHYKMADGFPLYHFQLTHTFSNPICQTTRSRTVYLLSRLSSSHKDRNPKSDSRYNQDPSANMQLTPLILALTATFSGIARTAPIQSQLPPTLPATTSFAATTHPHNQESVLHRRFDWPWSHRNYSTCCRTGELGWCWRWKKDCDPGRMRHWEW